MQTPFFFVKLNCKNNIKLLKVTAKHSTYISIYRFKRIMASLISILQDETERFIYFALRKNVTTKYRRISFLLLLLLLLLHGAYSRMRRVFY